jgi:Carboxypeptidase regulatory-like domain
MCKRIVRVPVILLLLGLPCLAQLEIREVTGIVVDKRGNALPGAAVQLENTGNLSVISYITGNDGRYHFSGLSSDIDYTLKAKYRKYWSERKTLSKFSSAKHPEVQLVIPID